MIKTDKIVDVLALPEDVRSFIYRVTLLLQANRSSTPKQMDAMFQDAYKLYVRYDVEGIRARDKKEEKEKDGGSTQFGVGA